MTFQHFISIDNIKSVFINIENYFHSCFIYLISKLFSIRKIICKTFIHSNQIHTAYLTIFWIFTVCRFSIQASIILLFVFKILTNFSKTAPPLTYWPIHFFFVRFSPCKLFSFLIVEDFYWNENGWMIYCFLRWGTHVQQCAPIAENYNFFAIILQKKPKSWKISILFEHGSHNTDNTIEIL